LEYGKGGNPDSWTLIHTSTSPQTKSGASSQIDASGDLTINGNLGTWDTGLKSYVYLPSHPADHAVDLRGTYTVRLVVTGQDGATVEDRTTVEVGEAVPNAWGAIVRSDDDRVTLTVPEQSLTEAFRVIAIRQLEHPPTGIALPEGIEGQIYQVREAGERFLKPAVLQMAGGQQAGLMIVAWDESAKRWHSVPSDKSATGKALRAELMQLSPYYAVAAGQTTPLVAAQRPRELALFSRTDPSMLTLNTFEGEMGQWSNRDGDYGADIALDSSKTYDGTSCLKISRRSSRGNFGVNVFRSPFDTREYPVVQFDYRIGPGVQTNFMARVAGRWYLVRFSGTPKDFQHRQVNITEIGYLLDAGSPSQ